MESVFSRLDHLVFATSDVAASVQDLSSLTGVTLVVGGRHATWATRNALLALGPRMYLEIIGPDPDAPRPLRPRPFNIDRLSAGYLVTWVARGENLEGIVEDARTSGVDLGGVQAGSRRQMDGSVLAWTMTDLYAPREGGVVPYFIDWGATPHPAEGLPTGCLLMDFHAEHPNAERVGAILAHLGLDLSVRMGPNPLLVASIQTPRGRIELR